MAAQHSALWGFDRWYRLWWYIWPASLALLISGWICIDKPTGVTLPSGSWAKPVNPDFKATWSPPNPSQAGFTNCFSNRFSGQIMRGSAVMACTGLISAGQISGLQLASVLVQRGFLQRETEPEKAMADYDAALKVRPDFGEAFDGRAWLYMTRGNYDAALQDLNKAISLLPPTSAGIARYYRGFAYLRLKKYPEALADLDEAQKIQPNNGDIYLARGEVEQAQEKFDAALRDFDEFCRRAPKDARGPISRGSVLEATGRSPEALTAFEAAVALEPGNAYAVGERDRLRAEQSEGGQRND